MSGLKLMLYVPCIVQLHNSQCNSSGNTKIRRSLLKDTDWEDEPNYHILGTGKGDQ